MTGVVESFGLLWDYICNFWKSERLTIPITELFTLEFDGTSPKQNLCCFTRWLTGSRSKLSDYDEMMVWPVEHDWTRPHLLMLIFSSVSLWGIPWNTERRLSGCHNMYEHTSAYVSTRQHTSAHVSTRQHTSDLRHLEEAERVTQYVRATYHQEITHRCIVIQTLERKISS